MPITVQTLLFNDTNYIAKHNANYAAIASAINALQTMVGNTAQANLTAPLGFEALIGSEDALIGFDSYVATADSGTDTITVSSGFAWLQASRAVVSAPTDTDLVFTGADLPGTYYIHVNAAGVPYRDQTAAGAFYSVSWSGSAFSALTKLVSSVFRAVDFTNALVSTALGTTYASLDARLEAGETLAVAGNNAEVALHTQTTKNVAGAADVTLSAGESRAETFTLTGALTGDIDVIVATSPVPRIISVKNDTTGDFEIVFRGAGGGVVVPQGYSSLLRVDGTSVAFANTDAYVVAKTIPYAASITLDWSKYDTAHITLTGDCTITHTNARPGQKCLLYLAQDGAGGRLVTWGSEVQYGSDIAGIALSAGAGLTDEIGFSYNWVASKYNVVSIAKGY